MGVSSITGTIICSLLNVHGGWKRGPQFQNVPQFLSSTIIFFVSLLFASRALYIASPSLKLDIFPHILVEVSDFSLCSLTHLKNLTYSPSPAIFGNSVEFASNVRFY